MPNGAASEDAGSSNLDPLRLVMFDYNNDYAQFQALFNIR